MGNKDIYKPSELQPIQIAGENVEIAVSSITEDTVRISIFPCCDLKINEIFKQEDICEQDWKEPVLRVSEINEPKKVKLEKLIVTLLKDPLTITVENYDGKIVQKLVVEEENGDVRFLLG